MSAKRSRAAPPASRGTARGREALAGLVVLLVNVVVMGVELLATRLLFPRYGNTIFTWSAIITIIITGLFAGYWAGGLLADRRPGRFALISSELAVAAILVLAVPWLCDRLLLSAGGTATLYPPILGCLVVFGLPAACLATVPPAVVGIVAGEGHSASAASGVVSALSALGSVLGTLVTTFWLVPEFGVRSLFVGGGVVLAALAAACGAVAGLPRLRRRAAGVSVPMAVALLAGVSATVRPASTGPTAAVYRKDSRYQLVQVFEYGEGPSLTRLLKLDSTDEGAMRMASRDVVFPYTRAYRAFTNAFSGSEAPRLLFIGGGAYTMPVRVAEDLPRARVEVAEIDPLVEEVARRYFDAGSPPNLATVLADGRQVVASASGAYDAVFVDAYQGVFAIPFSLTTREFFGALRGALKDGGFAAFNVIGDVSEREGFLCAFVRTLGRVFPRVDLYPVDGPRPSTQNVIIVAGPEHGMLDAPLMQGTGFPARLSLDALACAPEGLVLVDDHAPTEWLVAKYLSSP